MQPSEAGTNEIIPATDECVMCGLCLPHCPTYSVAKIEAESPRGRIAIVRALHENRLQPSPVLVNHLDQCLACMNCAAVCPVQIDYATILDAGRSITKNRHTFLHGLKQSLLLATLSSIRMRRLAKILLRIYHMLKVDYLFARLSMRFTYALRMLALIPSPSQAERARKPFAMQAPRARVMLVNSCAGDLFSDPAISAAEIILQALHCETVRLPQTPCCGALHQHSGNLHTARKIIQEFCSSCEHQEFDALVSLATGCAAQISRYPELLDDTRASAIASRHTDIHEFVAGLLEQHKLRFKPLPRTVFVHRPCTQKLVCNSTHLVEQLLEEIPEIRLEKFKDDAVCCGAGGMNVVTQAKLADHLIQNKITELKSGQAAYLVTSNIGCALHFQLQLSKLDSAVEVCHPMQLLARQLLYSEHA